jgi:hypothetical protein
VGLKSLAIVSGFYDLALALPMLVAAPRMAELFGAPPPVPLLNAQLNGVFTLTLAVGYFWAASDPEARRGYFWVAGVLAKGLGAALFVLDHFTEGSPPAFLLFAATDGALALATLVLLGRGRA